MNKIIKGAPKLNRFPFLIGRIKNVANIHDEFQLEVFPFLIGRIKSFGVKKYGDYLKIFSFVEDIIKNQKWLEVEEVNGYSRSHSSPIFHSS